MYYVVPMAMPTDSGGIFVEPPLREHIVRRQVTYELEQIRAQAELRIKFRRLADVWRNDVMDISSLSVMVSHPAYLRIIGLGWPAIPLLIDELARTPDYWFAALSAITDENPIPDEARGNLSEMCSAWLRWAEREGYV